MSFTVTDKFQVPWYDFPKVEKQLHCSTQCFSIEDMFQAEVVKLCERFVTDYWFIGCDDDSVQWIVGFIAPKDVVSFKTFFPKFTPYEFKEVTDKLSALEDFSDSYKNDKLKTFSLNFLRRLEGYAQQRKDKTVKFKLDIFKLVDVQAAILEKSKQKIKFLEQEWPELDGISTRRLLLYYRKHRDPVFVHTVGEMPREHIKQVLNTREHIEGKKPSWHSF